VKCISCFATEQGIHANHVFVKIKVDGFGNEAECKCPLESAQFFDQLAVLDGIQLFKLGTPYKL
jgi:hypothetical protein